MKLYALLLSVIALTLAACGSNAHSMLINERAVTIIAISEDEAKNPEQYSTKTKDMAYYATSKVLKNGTTYIVSAPMEKYADLHLSAYEEVVNTTYFKVYYADAEAVRDLCVSTAKAVEAIPLCY